MTFLAADIYCYDYPKLMNWLRFMESLKKKWFLAVVVILSLGLVAAFIYYLRTSPRASFEFVEIGRTDVKKIISVSGTVKPRGAVELAFESTGRVAVISAQVGDQVKAGQRLAILDQTDYSDQVNQALAGLEVANAGLVQAEANLKKEKERKEELVNNHASKYTVDVQKAQIKSAQAAVDIQRAQIASAQAALRTARDQHKKIVLFSPIDGVISKRNIEIGEVANPTNPVFSIISEGAFKVEANVTQKDVVGLEPGKKAEVTFDSCPESEKLESQIASVDPAEIQEDGNSIYKVSINLEKSSECLKSGVTANIEITVTERKNVLAVPASSVIKRNSQYFILVKDKEQGLREKEIKIGLSGSNNWIEVLSGIQEGEKVVSFSK